MTLFSLEGPSRAGKSTTKELLEKRHPEWISFSGTSIPERASDDFEEEWRREMQFYRPVYEQNPENVFLVERQFSELAYAHDPYVKDYVERTLAMWNDVHVLYFTADPDVLEERNSPDASRNLEGRYRSLFDAFDYDKIDTTDMPPAVACEKATDIIHEVMGE